MNTLTKANLKQFFRKVILQYQYENKLTNRELAQKINLDPSEISSLSSLRIPHKLEWYIDKIRILTGKDYYQIIFESIKKNDKDYYQIIFDRLNIKNFLKSIKKNDIEKEIKMIQKEIKNTKNYLKRKKLKELEKHLKILYQLLYQFKLANG